MQLGPQSYHVLFERICSLGLTAGVLLTTPAVAQTSGSRTYCNPIDTDYKYNFEQINEGMGNQANQGVPDLSGLCGHPQPLEIRALTVGQDYWFAIEAFNESGVSRPSRAVF